MTISDHGDPIDRLEAITEAIRRSDDDDARPVRPTTNWHTQHAETLTRGERAADTLRNGMGSWLFIGCFLAFMLAWAFVNAMDFSWDPYPYILLNLFLSMLAGLQGAILLIAAKRQDAIAAVLAQHDYETNVAAKRELEELMEINRLQLSLLRRLDAHGTGVAPAPSLDRAAPHRDD